MEKPSVFDAPEHTFALHSSIILQYRRFRKISKNQCQKGSKSDENWYKMSPGADQGRLIQRFVTFLGDVEKSLIFDVALGAQKSYFFVDFEPTSSRR